MSIEKNLDLAINTIQNSQALLITAGAGIGVDSGLPDFRGNQGLWQSYPALGSAKLNFTDIANPKNFHSQPHLAWGFYGHRLSLYRQITPHIGFDVLYKLCQKIENYFVVTSNVDGHFQKSGFPTDKIYEVHGSIHYLQCSKPCLPENWSADELVINHDTIDHQNCLWKNNLPKCKFCREIARPNILMFGDFAWVDNQFQKQADNFYNWCAAQLDTSEITAIEIGAGTAIPTIRNLSERFAKKIIRINSREAGDLSNNRSCQIIPIPMSAKAAITYIEKNI